VRPRRLAGVVVRPLNFTVRRTAMAKSLTRSSMSLAAAVLLGIAQMYFLTILWGYISIYTPLPRWLITLGLRGTALYAVVFLSDAILNIVFCLPVAYAICKLRPPRLFAYLILAIAPGFIWQYRLLLSDMSLLRNWAMFVPGVLLALAPLPLAALLVARVVQRAPNNRWRGP
jgi:hypothetical protein